MDIRQSTARTVIVGPVLDSTGAAKTDEIVGSILASKNGGDPAALNGSATLTHKAAGYYRLALTTSDTDTLGCLEIILNSGTNTMPVKGLNVLSADAWDWSHTSTGFDQLFSKRMRSIDPQLTIQRVVASQAVNTSFYFWNDALTGARFNNYDYVWGVCYVNGTADGTVTVSVSSDGGAEPKRWTASATLPSGLSDGDIVEIEVKAGFEDGVNPVLRTIVWRGYVDASVSSRSTLTQAQVTGGAYTMQNASCVLGDARIANLNAAVDSRAPASTALSTATWTALRAGYIDNLNSGVSLAAGQHVIVDSGTVTTLTNAPGDSSGVTTLLGRVVGTLAAGTHVAQSGDSYAITNDATNGNAAIKTAATAIKTKTDQLTFTQENSVDATASVALTAEDITTIATQVSASIDVTDDVAAAIAGVDNISVIGIVNGQHITLVRGDSYESTDARRKIAFTRVAGESWPTDLSGYTITFTARKSADNPNTGDATFTATGTVTTATGDAQVVTLATIASTATDSLAIGEGTKGYVWDLVATMSGGKEATLRMGVMTVKEDQTHA